MFSEAEHPTDTPVDDKFDVSSVITHEEMHRYGEEGFKLIAKRKPESFGDGSNVLSYDPFQQEAGPSSVYDENETIIRAVRISFADGLEYAASFDTATVPTAEGGGILKTDPVILNNKAMVEETNSGRKLIVYGEDTRALVQDPTIPDKRFIGQIEFKKQNGFSTFICGGTVISRNAVLTAGHCIYDSSGVQKPRRAD